MYAHAISGIIDTSGTDECLQELFLANSKTNADEHADWETFDDEKDLSQLEARITEWLNTHQAAPLKVIRVKADSAGGFQIFLEQKFVLDAFPAHSLRGEYSTYWRIFRPGTITHGFKVTGQGFCGCGIWT